MRERDLFLHDEIIIVVVEYSQSCIFLFIMLTDLHYTRNLFKCRKVNPFLRLILRKTVASVMTYGEAIPLVFKEDKGRRLLTRCAGDNHPGNGIWYQTRCIDTASIYPRSGERKIKIPWRKYKPPPSSYNRSLSPLRGNLIPRMRHAVLQVENNQMTLPRPFSILR